MTRACSSRPNGVGRWPRTTALERHVAHPDEHLLRGLGRAARLVPSLGPALAASALRPVTDAAGILAFLVTVPRFWRRPGSGCWRRPGGARRPRLALRLKARRARRPPARRRHRAGGSVRHRWEAVLGDDTLRLSRAAPWPVSNNPWSGFGASGSNCARGTSPPPSPLWPKGGHRRPYVGGEVLRRPSASSRAPGPARGRGGSGRLARGPLAGAETAAQPLPTPAGFAGQLRPYQERGLGWLTFLGDLGLGACLADDMGLGKTAQLLALLVDERAAFQSGATGTAGGTTQRSKRRRMAGPGPTLVLCPMSLVGNWQREVARFAPTCRSTCITAPPASAGRRSPARPARWTWCSRPTVWPPATSSSSPPCRGGAWSLDEAQQIKNSAARTTQSVRAIPADRRIAMTGTPVENRLTELWSIMQFLNPGMLGSEKAFRERFALPIERDGDDEAAAHLRRITGPFVLRRLKTTGPSSPTCPTSSR